MKFSFPQWLVQEKPMPRSHHQSPAEDGEGSIRGLHMNSNISWAMNQELFFNGLTAAISNDRFEPYSRSRTRSTATPHATYAWNITLCESLYPTLNCFEVALRNSVHAAATEQFGTEYWFYGRLRIDKLDRLNILRNRINFSETMSPSAGELVSGLSLGFWVSLFKGHYERVLWPLLLARGFSLRSEKATFPQGDFQASR